MGAIYYSELMSYNSHKTKNNGWTQVKKKRHRLRWIFFMYIRDVLASTSVHGASLIVKNHWTERLFWFAAVFISYVGTVIFGLWIFDRYNTSPTVMSVERDYFNWNTTIPAATICPIPEINDTLLDLLSRQYGGDDIETTKNFLQEMVKYSNYDNLASINVDDHPSIPSEKYLELSEKLVKDFHARISCSIEKYTPHAVRIITEMGICYIINSALGDYHQSKYWMANNTTRVNVDLPNVHLYDGEFFIQILNNSAEYDVSFFDLNISLRILTIIWMVHLVTSTSEGNEGHELYIIGGKRAYLGQFPYIAMISAKLNPGPQCTATIIDSQWLITAAHCIGNNVEYTVQVGMVDWHKPGPSYSIENVISHEGWNSSHAPDLALIKVRGKIAFNYKVNKIGLADSETPTNTPALMIGWGAEKRESHTGDDGPHRLNFIIGVALTYKDCIKWVSSIREKYICGKSLPNTGVCHGDSGGPMVVKNKIIGVLSQFGAIKPPACASEYPDGYVAVHEYLDWIKQHMKN